MEKLLSDLASHPDLSRGMLGIARFVPVKGGGTLSTLKELCRRAGQPGVNLEALAGSLSNDERRWVSRVPAAAGETIPDMLALLARFGVQELGDEDAFRQCADDRLARAFEIVPPGFRDSIESWIQTVSGAIIARGLTLHHVIHALRQVRLFFERLPTAARPTHTVRRGRIVAHQFPSALQDGRAAHPGDARQASDAAMSFPICQKANDASCLFLVETGHHPVQLPVLSGLRALRVIPTRFACAHTAGWLSHTLLDHAWIRWSSDQVNKVQPLSSRETIGRAPRPD